MYASDIDYVTADERLGRNVSAKLEAQREQCRIYLRARGKCVSDADCTWKPRGSKQTNIMLTFSEYEKANPAAVSEPFVLVGVDIPAFLRKQAY
ncbi:MAG: hypothetical protein K2Q20_11415 [Phycisphaerales bacterium]|nr:hypothetical protein [Phycisphaerales bacterium]